MKIRDLKFGDMKIGGSIMVDVKNRELKRRFENSRSGDSKMEMRRMENGERTITADLPFFLCSRADPWPSSF